MRVALVSLHSSPLELPATENAGGMNVVIYELARTLAKSGHAVTLVIDQTSSHRTVLSAPPGVTVREIDIDVRALTSDSSSTADARTLETLQRLLRDYDVIHAHYWLSGMLCDAALRARFAREVHLPPLVFSFHTLGAEKMALGDRTVPSARIRAERHLANSVPLIVSSHAEASAVRARYETASSEISVIPPGVDLRLFHPGKEVRPPQLLVVGRLQPYKGQDFALEVFAQLLQLPQLSPTLENLSLTFVGNATPGAESFAESVKARAVEIGLSERVHFLGALPRPELAQLFADSSVTIIPSRSETFGMVALESAASGTPVVAQRVGGLAESVRPGISGLLLDSRDAAVWTAALNQLLAHPEPLAQMRRGARQFAEAHSWDHTANLHLSAYRRAIAAAQ